MCGEKSTGILVWLEVIGSPPRMRGKAARLCLFSFFLGIAPAYAGKRLASAVVPPSSEDHPRVCGEKNVKMLKSKWKLGSPPRMRGKELHAAPSAWIQGITPAYAGKRICFASWKAKEKDHPRVCGEKGTKPSNFEPRVGSPPRMRGKAYIFRTFWGVERITPAYAGKSSCCFQKQTG